MKRFSIFLSLILAACICRGEKKQYATQLGPGELYFVTITNVTGGSSVWTNNETYMWYPAKAIIMSQSAITSTNTMQYVVKHTTLTQTKTEVVTNDFGNIQTNYLHGIGTDVNTFITNTVATWTNSASVRSAITPSDDYIQRGDIIRFTFSNTNVWLKLIGRR